VQWIVGVKRKKNILAHLSANFYYTFHARPLHTAGSKALFKSQLSFACLI